MKRGLLLWFLVMRGALAGTPINDHLVNALRLEGTNATVTATNLEATKEVGEPNHASNPGGRSVWWEWTAPNSGSVFIGTEGSSFDTLLAAYRGRTFAVMSGMAANDDNGSAATSQVAFNVIAGTTYLIAVDGYGGASGDIHLSLAFRGTPIQRPANDAFADRIPLKGSFVRVNGGNYLAGKEPGEPNHADELGGASVWWSWTASATGLVNIDTKGSHVDTLLAIYTGSVLTNLTLIAESDDFSTNQSVSAVAFEATAGEVYQVAVDGFGGEQGDIVLQIAMHTPFLLGLPQLLPDGSWRFTITGMAGAAYEIEGSSDLANWNRLAFVRSDSTEVEFRDTSTSEATSRFYRVRQIPPDPGVSQAE